jgi:hypothetical protein
VSSNVQGYFEELIDDAQDAILSMLGQRTLLEVLTELEVRENAKRQVRNPNRRYKHRSGAASADTSPRIHGRQTHRSPNHRLWDT